MVDEEQPGSEEEEAEHGLLLGQPSSGAAAEPLDEDEDGDDEAPEELTFACAQAEAREEELRVRESVRRWVRRPRAPSDSRGQSRALICHLFFQG